MNNALEVKNLCKDYGNFKLQNVNLTLPKGCILGFVGENGAGKSTTIKCILDLIHKDSGEITFSGETLSDNPNQIKDGIGVVFDDSYFHDLLKLEQINQILKNIYMYWQENTFFNYAQRFKLPKGTPIQTYSRGMRMKLSLAVALSHQAKLLILDEPTSGLDPVVRSEILDIFLEFIQNEEHAIILSTHITSDLEKIADYIAFIHQGKILIQTEKDALYENYTIVKGPKEAFKGLNRDAFISLEESAFHFEGLIKNAAEWQAHSPDFIYEKPTLEQIMVYFTKGANAS